MTERDGIIADAWNDHITERDSRDWMVSVRINLDLLIKADKDIEDDEMIDMVLERLNYDCEFNRSEIELLDMYQI